MTPERFAWHLADMERQGGEHAQFVACVREMQRDLNKLRAMIQSVCGIVARIDEVK